MFPTRLDVDELILRAPREDDFETWEELRAVPGIAKYVALKDLAEAIRDWESGYGVFLVEDVNEDAVVGLVGLGAPLRCDGPHLLAGVFPQFRGAGTDGAESRAVRACRAVLARSRLEFAAVFAHVDAENTDGIHLAEVLGGVRVHPPGSDERIKVDYQFP
jgi:hypothetical protein